MRKDFFTFDTGGNINIKKFDCSYKKKLGILYLSVDAVEAKMGHRSTQIGLFFSYNSNLR